MAQDQVETSGKTVEDALNKALAQLGASRDEVEFVVLDEGKRGGLFGRGGRDAVVRVERMARGRRAPSIDRGNVDTSIRRRPGAMGDGGGRVPSGGDRRPRGRRPGADRDYDAPSPRLTEDAFRQPSRTGGQRPERPQREERPEPAARAEPRPRPEPRPRRERPADEEEPFVQPNIDAPEVDLACQTIDDLLRLLDIDAAITIRAPESPGDGLGMALAVVDIQGDDLGLLIGRRGDTLQALQYLVNLVVNRRHDQVHSAVTIDVEQYRKRREMQLVELAERMGERVRRTGSSITLEPMTPAERRIIHIALSEAEGLETNSIGEGENRKVVISARE